METHTKGYKGRSLWSSTVLEETSPKTHHTDLVKSNWFVWKSLSFHLVVALVLQLQTECGASTWRQAHGGDYGAKLTVAHIPNDANHDFSRPQISGDAESWTIKSSKYPLNLELECMVTHVVFCLDIFIQRVLMSVVHLLLLLSPVRTSKQMFKKSISNEVLKLWWLTKDTQTLTAWADQRAGWTFSILLIEVSSWGSQLLRPGTTFMVVPPSVTALLTTVLPHEQTFSQLWSDKNESCVSARVHAQYQWHEPTHVPHTVLGRILWDTEYLP